MAQKDIGKVALWLFVGGIGIVSLLEYMFGFFGFQPSKAIMLTLIVLGIFLLLRAFTASRARENLSMEDFVMIILVGAGIVAMFWFLNGQGFSIPLSMQSIVNTLP